MLVGGLHYDEALQFAVHKQKKTKVFGGPLEFLNKNYLSKVNKKIPQEHFKQMLVPALQADVLK